MPRNDVDADKGATRTTRSVAGERATSAAQAWERARVWARVWARWWAQG